MTDESGSCDGCPKGTHFHGERGPELFVPTQSGRVAPYVSIVPTTRGMRRLRDALEDDDPNT